jgi:hypothetical protein
MKASDNEMRLEVEKFISYHIRKQTDLKSLSLTSLPWQGPRKREILQTIEGYRILDVKVPEWFKVSGLWFTTKKSLEQASSQKTAQFKAEIVNDLKIQCGVDLSGGLGVDSFFMAQKANKWVYVEQNKALFECFKTNMHVLGSDNIITYNVDAAHFLVDESESLKVDFIYVDPDRRPNTMNRRAVGFDESVPELDQIISFANKKGIPLLVKSSPMIDIKAGLQLLPAQKIYVISIKNEVKEVLWLYDPRQNEAVEKTIEIHELTYKWQNITANLLDRYAEVEVCDFSLNLFLNLPSSAIMKAGLNDHLAHQCGWNKAADFTHLYYSKEKPINSIPARTFKPIQELPTSLKKFKKTGLKKVNVICRNTRFSPAEFKKKYALIEGGDQFILCFTDLNNKTRLLLVEQV